MHYGPDRESDAYPMPSRLDVEAARRALLQSGSVPIPTTRGADPDWISDIERYGVSSAEELAAVRAGELEDYERWGAAPFDLE